LEIVEVIEQEDIWRLLARKMAGESTCEELEELSSFLKSDPWMSYIAETFSRLWTALPDHQTDAGGLIKIFERAREENGLQ
jgi:hypothetical protein